MKIVIKENHKKKGYIIINQEGIKRFKNAPLHEDNEEIYCVCRYDRLGYNVYGRNKPITILNKHIEDIQETNNDET